MALSLILSAGLVYCLWKNRKDKKLGEAMKEIKGFVAEYFGYDIVRDSYTKYHVERDGEPMMFSCKRANPNDAIDDCRKWINRQMESVIEDYRKKHAQKVNAQSSNDVSVY